VRWARWCHPPIPTVGKTVEGAAQWEATVPQRPQASVPQNSNKEKRKVASRPYSQYQQGVT